MEEFAKIWKKQCAAALEIKELYGTDKALGYLIGEKLMNFVKAAELYPEFAGELPEFVTEIKNIFQPWEISDYLENIKRVGALGHTCTDEEYEVLTEADATPDDPVDAVNDILTLGKITEFLL